MGYTYTKKLLELLRASLERDLLDLCPFLFPKKCSLKTIKTKITKE